ncbi:B12-binding domain-containing radical SAM protein [Candidatus Magnetomonas plexicatena]|uniref:B12-binding domain-containing radical SAM protein n=1 Tax=Candidatus Magnetomonas plexicatena TaxID=2552947 RepID=UPI001104E847|nr:B12-binding domain-containing radical SAM protein [Nitrospirales bacterium LBB_01]
MDNAKTEVVLIQPSNSVTGSFIKMLPIGLLYASSEIVKKGVKVHILDLRFQHLTWKNALSKVVNDRTLIVGITVMTGVAISDSLNISQFVKANYPGVYVVWGGPHPTSNPRGILSEHSIDFLIRGYGSEPFLQLYNNLTEAKDAAGLNTIPGLSYRDSHGSAIDNEPANTFEFIDYRDIPYHLIADFSMYKHMDTNEKVFPMYSVMGCPYKCAFCSSPAQYAKIGKKWQPYSITEVVSHIKMVQETYGATYIYFIDDDSFVDLRHVEAIIDELARLDIKVKLGFRGARINEIIKMSDEFIKKLVDAGTNSMHVGVESGSDRLLTLMKKNTTVEQILEVNRKLAKHPSLKVFYNFIVGFPTETIEETTMTRDLILKLIEDNPSCYIIPLNKPRPLPGTGLYELALKHGYKGPETLHQWADYEVESSNYKPVWLTDEHNMFIRMMFLSMYFIDDKIFKLSETHSFKYALLKGMASLYKPVAMFRFSRGVHRFLFEDYLYGLYSKTEDLVRLLSKIPSTVKQEKS